MSIVINTDEGKSRISNVQAVWISRIWFCACPINLFEPKIVSIDETKKKSAPTNVSDPKNVFNKENEKKPCP